MGTVRSGPPESSGVAGGAGYCAVRPLAGLMLNCIGGATGTAAGVLGTFQIASMRASSGKNASMGHYCFWQK
jgi:hypothetical protein